MTSGERFFARQGALSRVEVVKKFEKPRRWKRYILPVLLLAVACVGSVELWVCSFQAPDVYAAITAPIRSATRQAGEAGELFWNTLRQQTNRAVSDASARVQEGLQRLNDYLAREPDPGPEPDESEPQEEIQLVDDSAVAPPPNSRADDSVTTRAGQDGKEYLTGGIHNLIYYNQTDGAWAEKAYGSDTIGRYGCGPVAMAMVVSTLTETDIDPAKMARHCVDHGYWAKKHGSYWSIVPGVAEDFGLKCTSFPPGETERDRIVQSLATGQLLVAMMGPGHFTNRGHFIVLRGLTLDGNVLVADPASPDRSLIPWDLDLILEELSPNRSNGGPLWAISQN